jgi:hypothetical protein
MTIPAGSADIVFAVARGLLDLEERLARVEEERAALQAEIAKSMNQLAKLALDAVRPPAPPAEAPLYSPADPNTLAGQVLIHINRNPARSFTVRELTAELGITNRRMKTNIRAQFSRMARDGRIARADYGRYQAAPLK